MLFISGSCVEDVTESTKEPTRYTASDIKSYSDLFDVFWNTMNQKYNYFYEQSSLNWEAIYKEYTPKFKELKRLTGINSIPKLKYQMIVTKQ